MMLPRFSADYSLYRSSTHYRAHRSWSQAQLAAADSVTPQLMLRCPNGSMVVASPDSVDFVDGRWVTTWKAECSDGHGGPAGPGGRPPEPVCRPHCGPCVADEESRTGRSRLCITRDCDDYARPC
jgi:hypothetical protein